MTPPPTPRLPVEPWWAGEPGPSHRRPAARGRGARRGFGRTWWGQAWVDALEHRAALDPNRLPRGRGYARSGSVAELDITSGVVLAQVQGSRREPYEVVVRVRAFDDGEWGRVLDAVAASLGRAAALLDGELPPALADDVASAGLSLLPGPGEVQPRCSCPDWADPCKHSAAVCYLVADALDDDPFTLLRLRGRDREQVLAALRARRGGGASTSTRPAVAEPIDAVPAREVWAHEPDLPPLPPVPLPPDRPGQPGVLPVEPPAGSGITAAGLEALAADAARRAWQLATGEGDGGLHLDVETDLARRAAAVLAGPDDPAPVVRAMARAAGMTAPRLTSRAIAWRGGGADGLAALLDSWQPGPDEMADGLVALEDRLPPGATAPRAQANRITSGRVQLRLGAGGLWYLFAKSGSTWDLTGQGSSDPRTLLTDKDQV